MRWSFFSSSSENGRLKLDLVRHPDGLARCWSAPAAARRSPSACSGRARQARPTSASHSMCCGGRCDLPALAVFDQDPLERDLGDVAVFQKHHVVRVREQRHDVGGDETLAWREPEHERRAGSRDAEADPDGRRACIGSRRCHACGRPRRETPARNRARPASTATPAAGNTRCRFRFASRSRAVCSSARISRKFSKMPLCTTTTLPSRLV